METAIQELATKFYSSIVSPVSKSLDTALWLGDFDLIAKMKIDPSTYTCSTRFAEDYACVELLRKFPGLPVSVDRKAEALKSFWKSEKECYFSNERLSPYLHRSGECEGLSNLIDLVSKEVRFLLGRHEFPIDGRFGPGATFNDRGHLTFLPDKLSSKPTRTPNCVSPLFDFISLQWAALASDKFGELFERVEGNRFTTVPKTSLTDRGICIEPSINLFYQLGYGGLIRERLRRKGIDIKQGQELHKAAAREASRDGTHATIDLSSASDTVCKNLVRLLLPEDWNSSLEELRSPKTLVDGKWIVLEKFSSMGNGYTFELETLIFAAICGGCIRWAGETPVYGDSVKVYGDDIIVPIRHANNVLTALRFFGFTPNDRKTFLWGPFRESCGGDFFYGDNVRPYQLDVEPTEPSDWISICNGIRRVGYDAKTDTWKFGKKAWFHALHQIPVEIRNCRGPERLGDIVIHDTRRRWQTKLDHPPGKRSRSNPGTTWAKAWTPVPKPTAWGHWKEDVQLVSRVYRPGDYSDGFTGRGSTSGFKHSWVSVS